MSLMSSKQIRQMKERIVEPPVAKHMQNPDIKLAELPTHRRRSNLAASGAKIAVRMPIGRAFCVYTSAAASLSAEAATFASATRFSTPTSASASSTTGTWADPVYHEIKLPNM
jgi:hypothetical protein